MFEQHELFKDEPSDQDAEPTDQQEWTPGFNQYKEEALRARKLKDTPAYNRAVMNMYQTGTTEDEMQTTASFNQYPDSALGKMIEEKKASIRNGKPDSRAA